MLQTLLISDTHLEFYKDNGIKFIKKILTLNPELLIIAGDFNNGPELIKTLQILSDNIKYIVYVTGNHEYYFTDFYALHNKLRALEKINNNFFFLNNKRIKIEHLNFIGATLWYPETKESTNFINQSKLNDFRRIKHNPSHFFKEHKKTVDYFSDNIENGDIVITHHMPSLDCIATQYSKSPLNCFFASSQDLLIKKRKPLKWFFGHTHTCIDIKIGQTNLKCNPKGYPAEKTNFSFSLFEL